MEPSTTLLALYDQYKEQIEELLVECEHIYRLTIDYELLDQVLKLYIEKNIDATKIIASGFEKALVDRVVAMVDKAEYKRRQYPPGPKVSPIAFGKDRRLPMTSRWRES